MDNEKELLVEEEIHESGVKNVNMSKEIKTAFLDYAMSVIVSRALPDVRDGLKPVHRRIVHAMNELGVQSDKAYKKSARIVGDTMGKYHPHGDTAIYDALVRLAQDFSSRYPLVDGHGNFGSVDGDGAAAMRYTEARMSKIVMEMVKDINKETVDFVDNYDGTEKEPSVLPARFPNLLVNGTTGIAVGMATNIPPHNLTEVINGLLALIDNPELEVIDLMEYIKGPDFPTGASILGKGGIKKAYETGNGSILIRSKSEIEETKTGKKRIIVTAIPYQVNKTTLLQKIVDLVKNKIIDGISDLRDESNRIGMRIVIELKKDAIPEVILNNLYKLTQLQTTFGANMLAIVNGEPKVLNLKNILNYYLLHQEEIITRRTTYDLNKALDREHLLFGLKIATENLDEVLDIIRKSQTGDEAIEKLTERFNFSNKQCKAILDMRLQRLTGLEREKIILELKELEKTIEELNLVLSNKGRLLEIIKEELIQIRDKYGDERKTEISDAYIDIEDEDLIAQEDIVVSITINGYIKRVSLDTYRTQNRGGRGVKGMTINEDDIVDRLLITNTHTDLLFFSNKGKVYRIRAYKVPEYSRQAKGLPIINLLNIDKDEDIKAMITLDEYDNSKLLFVTKNGIAKRVELSEFESIRQNGKIAIGLRENDELYTVKKTNGNEDIFVAANNGKLVRFNENNIRTMGRTASGVKSINLGDNEFVVGVTTSNEGENILVISERGYGKMSPLDEYRQMVNRGGKGVKTIKVSQKNGKLMTIRAVNGDEDLLVITDKGVIIRLSLEQVKVASRNTMGVRIIKLDEDSIVSSVAVVRAEEESEEVMVEQVEEEKTEE